MTRVAGVVLTCGLLLGSVAACGVGEGGDRPTASPSFTPSRTLPSPTRTPIRTSAPTDATTPTQDPTTEPTTKPTTRPTPEPTTEPTTAEPTQDPTTEPTEDDIAGPTATATAPTESPTTDPDADATSEEDSDNWIWWLLAGLLLAAGTVAGLLVARHRRQDWHARLDHAEAEATWLARELLPQLRDTGSLAGVAGGWQVAEPRVVAAEDDLTILESTAKDEADAARARAVRDAVRDVRTRIGGLGAADPTNPWVLEIDDAIRQVEVALAQDDAGT